MTIHLHASNVASSASTRVIRVLALLFALCAAINAPFASAQASYPDRQIRLLIGYPPGGGADVMARIVAEALREGLDQPVVVENRPGATGNIAAQVVVRAPADGYTLFFGTSGEIAINRLVMKDVGFDPSTDLVPVVLGFNVPLALVVPGNSPFKSLADPVAFAKQNPGKLNFASSGSGTPGHLAGELLAVRTHTKMVHVPYKGGGPALTDLIGGRVDFYFAALNSVLPLVKAGTLHVLALSSATRSRLVPDIPTVAELPLPAFDIRLWGGVFAPAKTPPEIITRLNQVAIDAYHRPDVKAKIDAQMSEIPDNSPAQFGALVKSEMANYAAIVKEVGYVGQ